MYTYSVALNDFGNDWMSMGFGNANVTGNMNVAGNPWLWMLERQPGVVPNQAFFGGATANATSITNLTGLHTFTLVMDAKTVPSNWMFTWLEDGVVVLGPALLRFGSSDYVPGSVGELTTATGTVAESDVFARPDVAADYWRKLGHRHELGAAGIFRNPFPTRRRSAPSIAATSATVVTLDSNQTIGQLTFANSTFAGGTYTIAQGTSGTLTFDNGGSGAVITSYYNNNMISAPVLLNDNLQVNAAAGTALVFTGAVSASGNQTLTVNSGGLQVTSPGTISNALVIASGLSLGGTGTVTGTLTLGNGTHFAPGMNTVGNFGSIGTLTFNNLALPAGTFLDLDLGAPGTSDLIASTGALTLPDGGFRDRESLEHNGPCQRHVQKILTFGQPEQRLQRQFAEDRPGRRSVAAAIPSCRTVRLKSIWSSPERAPSAASSPRPSWVRQQLPPELRRRPSDWPPPSPI